MKKRLWACFLAELLCMQQWQWLQREFGGATQAWLYMIYDHQVNTCSSEDANEDVANSGSSRPLDYPWKLICVGERYTKDGTHTERCPTPTSASPIMIPSCWFLLTTLCSKPASPNGKPSLIITLPDALNNFYARFEASNTSPGTRLTRPPKELPLRVAAEDVWKSLLRINPRKVAGPDNIPGRVLNMCTLAHWCPDRHL